MSFFNLSDNQDATKTGGNFETGGGDIEPIPSNTDLLAAPDEAKWDFKDSIGTYISVRWTVLAPKDYANRKVFQKIRVLDSDTKKADKAKRMLAAIDANAGGKLAAAGVQPTDESMQVALINKPMVIKVQMWEIEKEDGTMARGNWVCAVSPRTTGGAAPTPARATPAPAAPTPEPAEQPTIYDKDVPF